MAVRRPVTASTFMYPWDLADMGVREALTRLQDEGYGAFELTACYHPITLHMPGAPGRRMMQMDDGGVFFPARADRYGRIAPRLYPEGKVLAAWPQAAEVASDLGLDMNSWTVALYQPWIAQAYPHTARVMPHGQVNFAGVCPTCPDVQEFLAILVGDLAEQFPVRTVQLEGVNHPFYDTGWRLQRVMYDLSPFSRWLASLCFCESCIAAATARGVAVQRLRASVCAELETLYLDDDPHAGRSFDEAHGERLAADADYAEFIAMRRDACVQLVRGVTEALHAARPSAALGIWGPQEFDGTYIDLDRVIDVIGVLQTRQPLIAPDNARAARELADVHGMRVTAVHWCGGRIGPPWGPGFEEAIASSVAAGIDQINLFNWAMLRPETARQIVPLLRRLEAEHAAAAA